MKNLFLRKKSNIEFASAGTQVSPSYLRAMMVLAFVAILFASNNALAQPPCREGCPSWIGPAIDSLTVTLNNGSTCTMKFDYYYRTCFRRDTYGICVPYYDFRVKNFYQNTNCGDAFTSEIQFNAAEYFDSAWAKIASKNPWGAIVPDCAPGQSMPFYRRSVGACYYWTYNSANVAVFTPCDTTSFCEEEGYVCWEDGKIVLTITSATSVECSPTMTWCVPVCWPPVK